MGNCSCGADSKPVETAVDGEPLPNEQDALNAIGANWHESEEPPAEGYCIAGSWNQWKPEAMKWEGCCFTAIVTLSPAAPEQSFQILVNGSWETVLHPSVRDASPRVKHKVLGPSQQSDARDQNWKLSPTDSSLHSLSIGFLAEFAKAKLGIKYEVKLVLDKASQPKRVVWDVYAGARDDRRTVVCIAGLASSSLDEEVAGQAAEVVWCNVESLVKNPLYIFNKLSLQLARDFLKDGTPVNSTASQFANKITPHPGIQGTEYLNPGGKIPVAVWATLIKELEEEFHWHSFGYDWRRWGELKYAEETVDRFKQRVEEAIKEDQHEDQHPSGKAALVCHSMGCTVACHALSVIDDDWVRKHIEQVVFVAPAHMGSPSMMSSFAHCPFFDTQSSFPVPVRVSHEVGDLAATWPCMLAEMPTAVGGELPWPEDHVFATTPERDYRLADMGQFLEDLNRCKKAREIGPALWPGVSKLAAAVLPPKVPTSIIYGNQIDTPSQVEYETSDFSRLPRLKSCQPGDGTIVASSVEAVALAWQKKGAKVRLLKEPDGVSHKNMVACPFTVAMLPRLLRNKTLTPIRVTLVSAAGLRDADGYLGGKSDDYCCCELLGKPSTKRYSPVVSNDLNPVWNHTEFIYGYSKGDVLFFKVMDKDVGFGEGDFLGEAAMSTSDILSGFEGVLQLGPTGHGFGSLTVKVAVVEEME